MGATLSLSQRTETGRDERQNEEGDQRSFQQSNRPGAGVEDLHALLEALDELRSFERHGRTSRDFKSTHPCGSLTPITFKRLRSLHLTSVSSPEGSYTLGTL